MEAAETFTLENMDPDDASDCIASIARSLNIELLKDDFLHVKTWGELCDVFLAKIPGTEDGCTTQQAYYKLREQLAAALGISSKDLQPATPLISIIPAGKLRQTELKLQKSLHCSLKVTTIKPWGVYILMASYPLSLACIFYRYDVAFSLIAVTILFNLAASRWILMPAFDTVGDLARELALRHYAKARRQPGTVNKAEIIKLIEDTFIAATDISRAQLTRNAKI